MLEENGKNILPGYFTPFPNLKYKSLWPSNRLIFQRVWDLVYDSSGPISLSVKSNLRKANGCISSSSVNHYCKTWASLSLKSSKYLFTNGHACYRNRTVPSSGIIIALPSLVPCWFLFGKCDEGRGLLDWFGSHARLTKGSLWLQDREQLISKSRNGFTPTPRK